MANELTAERMSELRQEYDVLKGKIMEIDHKYSLTYQEVTMDFPESLGLEKIEYTPHTTEQLQTIATEKLAAKYLEKQRQLSGSYAASTRAIEYSVNILQEKHRAKLVELAQQYQAENDKLVQKAIANGLMYSTLKTDALNKNLTDYNGKVTEQTTHYTAELGALDDKQTALDNRYQSSVSELDSQKSADITRLVEELRESETKYATNIQKYNMSLDEREAKYQASCTKALQYAIQGEYDRSLAAARLYAELGEAGSQLQMCSEKLSCCCVFFTPYHRNEAYYILSLDNFLQANLGEFYATLEDWVDNYTLP